MRQVRIILFASLLATVFALVPVSAPALSLPATLAANRAVGAVDGRTPLYHQAFPIGFLGVSWVSGKASEVRFETAGRWSAWEPVLRDDDLPTDGNRTYSELIPAGDAQGYELRGDAAGVRTVAINTTDGPRHLVWRTPTADAALSEPPVVSRAGWGANESYRFDASNNEVWPPAFYPTQKLTVHHTAGQNNDPDPAATVRAIYYYHAVTRGYGDIGYNFLIDAQGNIYKGRWSGPGGDSNQNDDTATGENGQGYGVTAAHVGGYNSGNVGVAILGTYDTADISQQARSSLVDFLAWESQHHNLDPQASSTYTNPVNGTQKFEPNISGHRDWAATDCPGGILYSDLPSIRRDVAAKVNGSPTPPPATAPFAPTLTAGPANSKGVALSWSKPGDGGSSITGYRVYRSRSSGNETFLTQVGNVTAYTDTGTRSGRVYYYEVSAVNSVGEGQRSNEAHARAT